MVSFGNLEVNGSIPKLFLPGESGKYRGDCLNQAICKCSCVVEEGNAKSARNACTKPERCDCLRIKEGCSRLCACKQVCKNKVNLTVLLYYCNHEFNTIFRKHQRKRPEWPSRRRAARAARARSSASKRSAHVVRYMNSAGEPDILVSMLQNF